MSKILPVTLTSDLYKEIKKIADDNHVSMASWIRIAIKEKTDREKQKNSGWKWTTLNAAKLANSGSENLTTLDIAVVIRRDLIYRAISA